MAKPYVKIPVTDLDRLMDLTDAQMRVWLYYKRREGADGKAYGKSTTIAAWCGYTSETSYQSVKNARSWLRRHGWLTPNGRSKSGLPQFLAVIPRLPLEADDRNLQITVPSSYDYGAVTTGLPQPSSYDYTEVDNHEEATKRSNLKDSVLTDGQLVSRSASSTTPSASDVDHQQEQHQNQTVPSEQVKTSPEIKALKDDLGGNKAIPALLGLPYFYSTPEHEQALTTMATVLWWQDRSIYWLECMVKWIKEHKFWSKRVHTGDRGVAQLAKHLMNMELVEQFNAHLVLTQGENVIDPLNANYSYCLGRSRQAVKAASAGFNLEEAE